MSVNNSLRRIATLSAFVLAVGTVSISHAGVIPWVYDAVFGPVRYPAYGYGYGYGYSPYVVSYERPVVVRNSSRSSGCSMCSSCSTGYYAPVVYAAPSCRSSCGPVVTAPSCGTYRVVACGSTNDCLSGCGVTSAEATTKPSTIPGTTNNKKAAGNWTTKEPEKEPAPTPRTFEEPKRGASPAGATTDDEFGPSGRSRGTAVPAEKKDDEATIEPIKVKKPETEDVTDQAIPNRKKAPTKPADDEFELPVQKPASESNPPATELEPAPKNSENDSATRVPQRRLNFDAKIAWQPESHRSRVPQQIKLAKATVTRRSPTVDADWTPVIARSVGVQIVKK